MTNTYTGPAGGDWFSPSNWSAGVVPASGTSADITGISDVTISNGTVNDVSIAISAQYELIEPGIATAYNLSVGSSGVLGASSTVTVADGSNGYGSDTHLGSFTGRLRVLSGSFLTDFDPIFDAKTMVNQGSVLFVYSGSSFADGTAGVIDFKSNITVDNGSAADIFATTITGNGSVTLLNSSLAGFAAPLDSLTSSANVIFGDQSADVLDVAQSGTFSGVIKGFGGANTIDVASSSSYGVPDTLTYENGVLSIYSQGGVIEQLRFAGQYSVTNFVVSDQDVISYVPATTGSVIAGTVGDQYSNDYAATKPFSSVVIEDPNGVSAIEKVTVTSSNAANGTLVDPNLATDGGKIVNGAFTVTGTSGQVTSAIDGLQFDPTHHQVPAGQDVYTTFTISDTNSAGVTTADSTTSLSIHALNYIYGTPGGHNVLLGTSGQDVITAFGEGNLIFGQGGDDYINAGAGQAFVNVGSGSTDVTLSGQQNIVVGGDGNNTVTGASGGGSAVVLGNGSNTLTLGGDLNYVLLGNGDNVVSGTQGLSFITTGSGNDTISVGGFGNTVSAGGGDNSISSGFGLDTFVLPKASAGLDTISGFSLFNLDRLDLSDALAATTWNGSASTLGNYVKVADQADSGQISIAASGVGVGIEVAKLTGLGQVTLASLTQHGSLVT